MKLGVIFAVSRNGVIGNKGKLPWNLPEDLKHFKEATLGLPIVMGRKTWESLPRAPLPGRVNVVVSASLEDPRPLKLQSFYQVAELPYPFGWVIGGVRLFEVAIPRAELMCVTRIDADYEGDTYLPYVDYSEWETDKKHTAVSSTGLPYTIEVFVRKSNGKHQT